MKQLDQVSPYTYIFHNFIFKIKQCLDVFRLNGSLLFISLTELEFSIVHFIVSVMMFTSYKLIKFSNFMPLALICLTGIVKTTPHGSNVWFTNWLR